MITKTDVNDKKTQIQMISLDQLVPEDHILRKIDRYIDFSFIYDLVEEKYSTETGRPSIDPVVLVKIGLIQFMFGIKSMRQTIKEIEVNVAYRWFLGLDFYDKVPHFSTFGKNYKRRFEGTDLFEQIFMEILMQCMRCKVINTDTVFIDATHVKAAANRKKAKKVLVAKKSARFYDEQLKEEINADRIAHGKAPLKERPVDNDDDHKDDDDHTGGSGGQIEMKEQKQSETDPESGWFHKGEHKEVFAYSVQAACDESGWILGYSIRPGNEHDSKTFKPLYDKLKKFDIKTMVMDSGYKNPAIAKLLIYDEYYDCYICPNNQILSYSTTNRDGYREYKSNGEICGNCPYLSQCTNSKNHVKVITHHIWQDYMEICEDIRHSTEMEDVYAKRKQTIERNFGTAKEHHAMRYTQLVGNEKMSMKVGLTFACMNMKKLVKILAYREKQGQNVPVYSGISAFLLKLFNRPQISLT